MSYNKHALNVKSNACKKKILVSAVTIQVPWLDTGRILFFDDVSMRVRTMGFDLCSLKFQEYFPILDSLHINIIKGIYI